MPSRRSESLLHAREAWGLRMTALARIAMVVVFSALDLWMAQSTLERIAGGVALLLIVGVNLLILRAAGRGARLGLWGSVGVSLDIAALIMVPMGWYLGAISTGTESSLAVMLKAPLAGMALLFIGVNALALRPLYPAMVTVAGALCYIVLGAIVFSEPGVPRSQNIVEVFSGPAVSVGMLIAMWMLIVVGGGLIVLVTAIARRTVREAVRLEQLNLELREAQAEVVAREKLQALARLVAGLAHEVNAPLGAVSSSSETSGHAMEHVRAALERAESLEALRGDRKLERALEALERGSGLAREAGQRIGEVLRTLERFISLDGAELQELDLRGAISDSLALVAHKLGRRIRVERDDDEAPTLLCHPARIHQLLASLLDNAVEAIDGAGTLRVSARRRDDEVELSIADDGRGIAAERLPELFDVRFSERPGQRVRAGMSLAICRAIARQHGGDVELESALGEGTTVRVRLPLAPPG